MQGVSRNLRPIHFRVILADDDQRVSALKAKFKQAHAKIDGLLVNFIPGIFLPDAVAFLALSDIFPELVDA